MTLKDKSQGVFYHFIILILKQDLNVYTLIILRGSKTMRYYFSYIFIKTYIISVTVFIKSTRSKSSIKISNILGFVN